MCLSTFQKKNKVQNKGMLAGILAESRRKGMTRAILRIPVELLMIDERYQTPIRTERNMSYLINNWDEHKLLPLTVVPHDEEGVFAVVDGYGRLQASQKVNKERYNELECLVILDAPTKPGDRLKFEAEEYAFQNENVARVKPLHKHGAFRITGNKQVLDLDKLKEKYGFEYTCGKGKRCGEVLGSYTDCLRILRSYGFACMDYIFSILQKSGFERQTNGYNIGVVRGLRDMWCLYTDDRETIAKFFTQKLRKLTPLMLNATAKTEYPLLDCRMAVSMYMEDMLVAELKLEQKRYVAGTKTIRIDKHTAA